MRPIGVPVIATEEQVKDQRKKADEQKENEPLKEFVARLCKKVAEDGQTDLFQEQYTDGQVSFEFDRQTLELKRYYQNGHLKDRGSCNPGEITPEGAQQISYSVAGIWEHYDSNGNLETRCSYGFNGRFNGLYESYHANGQVKDKGEYASNSYRANLFKYILFDITSHHSTDKEGIWESYDEQGRLVQESEYNKDVELHVTFLSYHDNGAIKNITRYGKNRKTGLSLTFYPTGQLFKEETYKKDALKSTKFYHPSGRELSRDAEEYVWPVQVEDVDGNTVSLVNRHERVIGTGQIDGNGQACGAWQFLDEPAEWVFSWQDDGEGVASALTAEALLEDSKVLDVIKKQSGMPEQLQAYSVERVLGDIEIRPLSSEQDIHALSTRMLLAGGTMPLPGIERKKASRRFSAATSSVRAPQIADAPARAPSAALEYDG
jgi:antitoxin component YwqK of YwqJK toxin-antitoxin module